MKRTLITCLAALALLIGTAVSWAEDKPAAAPVAPTPAAPAAAAPGAAAEMSATNQKIRSGREWFGYTYGAFGDSADDKKLKEDQKVMGWKKADEKETGVSNSMVGADNAWMLICSALVLLMTAPGLALFYGGLVRRKNVLGTMMQSLALVGIVTVIWTVVGFSLAFGDGNAYIGSFTQYLFLKDVVWSDAMFSASQRYPISGDYAPTFAFGSFAMFQLMFAIITPALICGAYAERMKFSGMVLFSTLWLLAVYCPMAHMVWGKGGLFNWGFGAVDWAAFDFAGGTVVHISSGVAALVAAIILGKRHRYPTEPMPPHSLVASFIGACLLWVGWFGFNAGSALGAGGLATLAFVNTQIAAAAAALTWPLAEWVLRGKPTVLGAISGAVAGLVAITPACGFTTPGYALVIGLIAGVLCMVSSSYLKRALGYDDALDAFGVHGVGGTWGALATGIFLVPDANPCIPALNPDLYVKIAEHGGMVLNQIKAVVITIIFSGVASTVILLLVKYTVGIRVDAEQESEGLDISQHGEEGYHGLA